MLSPPNQGSEVIDKLGSLPIFYLLNGPAGRQLGTDKDSVPRQLGSFNFDAGIITGYKTINPLLSLLIPGKNDGKVSVERARIKGMKDFLVVPSTHSFIMLLCNEPILSTRLCIIFRKVISTNNRKTLYFFLFH